MAEHERITTNRMDRATLLQWAGRLGLIVLGSFAFGLVVPGLVAMRDGVFFPESLKAVVTSRIPETAPIVEKSKNDEARLKQDLAAIDTRVVTDPQGAAGLASLRQTYEADLRKPKPISLQPLYLHILMYYWPISYFGLSVAVFLLHPPIRQAERFVKRPFLTLATAAGIYLFSAGPLIFRTEFVKSIQQNRTVFAYCNPDVDLPSHIVQLCNFGVFALLLAAIWIEWSAWMSQVHREIRRDADAADFGGLAVINALSKSLLHWQLVFAAISIGFVMYTGVFWDQLIINGDSRFGYEAIVIHPLWITTAVFTVMPFVLRWHAWQQGKIKFIAGLVNSGQDSATINGRLEALQQLRPIGTCNLTASSLTVVASFVVPLMQAILKKIAADGRLFY
jgi:hypothetical protein